MAARPGRCPLVPDRPARSLEREEHERLTKLKALAVFSSDNISSSAYATEEMMRILVLAGVGAIALAAADLVIVVVLAIVAHQLPPDHQGLSQRRESYIVASDNLGDPSGLVAAGGAADRLHVDRRGLGLRRRGGDHLDRPGSFPSAS